MSTVPAAETLPGTQHYSHVSGWGGAGSRSHYRPMHVAHLFLYVGAPWRKSWFKSPQQANDTTIPKVGKDHCEKSGNVFL